MEEGEGGGGEVKEPTGAHLSQPGETRGVKLQLRVKFQIAFNFHWTG